MSRAVDRGRLVLPPPPGRAPPASGLTLPSRLSSRFVTVQHGESRLRHLPGDRRGRRGRRSGRSCPALAVGALGAGDIQIDFAHCDMSWLQKPPFLLAMAVCAIVLAILERRLSTERLESAAGGAGARRGLDRDRGAAVRGLAVPGRLRDLAGPRRRRDLRPDRGARRRGRCWRECGPASRATRRRCCRCSPRVRRCWRRCCR